jgi:exodeoxyribonuclease V beta subunit
MEAYVLPGSMKTVFKLATATLEPGVSLIEASAGTGKTFCLAGLTLRLLLEQHIPISEILAVTYTVAATKELKDRVRRRLQEASIDLRHCKTNDETLKRVLESGNADRSIRELDLAIQGFDEAQVFTIHGFCQRILHDHAFESAMAFDAELVTDATPLFEQVAKDFWRLKFYKSDPLIPAIMLAWEKSPNSWAELLDRIRNHPDVVFIPPSSNKPWSQLKAEIEESFKAIATEWKTSRSQIQKMLREDKNLARRQDAFPLPHVEELLKQFEQACGGFDCADPKCIKALTALTTEAIAAGTKHTGTSPEHRFFDLCSVFSALVDELFNHLTYEFLQYAKAELPKRKAKTNIVTFDDLILRLRDALIGPGGAALAVAIGKKYQAALIDEFQDTDPAQYEIFQPIFGTGKHRLYYIGDPKQAIYGFRGADVFTYLAAAANANHTFTLGTNWRSEKKLVEAISQLFQQVNDAFVLPGIGYQEVRASSEPEFPVMTNLAADAPPPLQFRIVPSSHADGSAMNQTEAKAVICAAVRDDIVELKASGAQLDGRPIGFGDMAVLVRTHAQAAQMQEELRAHGIPSIVQSERSVFASSEALELQQLLQGILEPKRERLFKAALTTNLLGLKAVDLLALDDDEALRERWLDRFSEWQNKWINECFIAVFRQILVEQNIRAQIVELPGGERRLTNFLHLAELLHGAETAERLKPDGLCSWLKRQRANERVSQDEFQIRLESDADAVQIVTIHKCKGLEYPIVFCPFLWTPAEFSGREELQFHDRNNGDCLTLSLTGKAGGTDQQRAWQTEEIISEEVRMLYVAVTRAKNRCTIHLGDIKKSEQSPLARLFNEANRGDLIAAVTAFAAQSGGCAAASVVHARPAEEIAQELAKRPVFAARKFNGAIDKTAMVASFSGLNSGRVELEEPEPEVADQPDEVVEEEITTGDTIFDFERGARAGDFFHAVLERLDFEDPDLEPVVDAQLGWHGFTKTKCRTALLTKFQELLNVEFEPGISLKKISKGDWRSELEFTYRLNRLDPARLRKLFKRCGAFPSGFTDKLGRLRFDPVEGYLRGFIDLFFQFGGRYYIIDWKSNWLGNRPSDYDEAGMRDSMLEHNYFLQSHLYVLAADLFLQSRLKDYDYQRHFGGVLYVFLRGVDHQKPGRGVFRQKPGWGAIKALRELAE